MTVNIIMPAIAFVVSFMLCAYFLARGAAVDRLKMLVGVFLKDPATLKTWSLVLGGPALCLMFQHVIEHLADSQVCRRGDGMALACIHALENFGYGFILLLMIVLGALGAVTFKGQLPGGASVQINPDGSGSASVPAPLPDTGGKS